MQTPSTTTCDRCGVPRTCITAKATNGMVAWECDLCVDCYEDVKALMLYKNRRYQTQSEPK